MNKKYILISIITLLSISYWYFLLCTPSCKAENACIEIQKNAAMMQQLGAKNDSIWAFTHKTIDAALPTDIDTLLRVRMTTLKQVKYIVSYNYFKQMSPDLQMLILKTGEQDSIAAATMRDIMKEQGDNQKTIAEYRTHLKKVPLGSYYLKKMACK